LVLGAPALPAIMEIYKAFKSRLNLEAYEMFTDVALKYVLAQGRVNKPFDSESPFYVLVEFENDSEATLDLAMTIFEECVEKGFVTDGVVSQNPQQLANLWALREDISEATSVKKPYKNDVSVRVSRVPQFLEEMSAILNREHPDFEVVWFGHVGDGNLHINILKPDSLSSEEFVRRCKSVDEIMFAMIERLGGSISAEHGVGLTKKPFLYHTRSSSEIALMKQIKRAFDPDLILNPGKIFDI
jgi:FAD/FMN-containing dehydrogenase